MVRAWTRACALSVSFAFVGGCSIEEGVTESQRETILEWLTCGDCRPGLRATVAAMGEGAITILDEPFDTTGGGGRRLAEAARERARESYRNRNPGLVAPDTYVTFFAGNFVATTQMRAAMSLGDLAMAGTPGALSALQDAMADSLTDSLRSDVRLALRSAEARAIAGAAVIDSVVVLPTLARVNVGETLDLLGVALDASAVPTSVPLGWVVADPLIASIDASTGRVRGVSPGTTLVKAGYSPTGDTGTATVEVAVGVLPPVIHFEGGDNFTGTGAILMVSARRPNGTGAAGVPVTWSVTSGGSITPQESVTTPAGPGTSAGVARAFWHFGGGTGTQTARIVGPNGVPVVFQAAGVPPGAGTATLRGRVLVNGNGSNNVTVTLTGAVAMTSTTNSAGGFSFTGLPVGNFTVSITPPAGTTFAARAANFSTIVGDVIAAEFRGIGPTPVVITTTALATAQAAFAYSQALAATGGNGQYAWSITVGALPPGLSMNTTGVITGTPNATGTFNFTARATSAGLSDDQVLTIIVG